MKVEGGLFVGGTVLYTVLAIIYSLVSGDVVGTTVLAMTAGLALIIGFYILFTGRRVGVRPEDRDGDIEEADPNFGFYSPHSWWPLMVAFGAAMTFSGLIFAVWIVVLGVGILLMSVVGWLFEYHVGDFAE